VNKEEELVREDETRNVRCDGLRVVGVEKTYFKKSCGKSPKDVHAVQGIYLDVPKN
jgi:hypothetical protein